MERSRTDLYRVLQVDPAANQLVIQAAYRVLAQIFHPDVSGDDSEMKRINAAWEVLGDPKRRREYDIERAGRHAPPAPHAQHGQQPSAAAHAPARASHASATASAAAGTRADAGATVSPRDHAGPPQGPASGSVIKFGRYEGWTIGQVARVDPPFLEWLRRVPAGRGLQAEIDTALKRADGARRMGVAGHAAEGSASPVHTWAPKAPTNVR